MRSVKDCKNENQSYQEYFRQKAIQCDQNKNWSCKWSYETLNWSWWQKLKSLDSFGSLGLLIGSQIYDQISMTDGQRALLLSIMHNYVTGWWDPSCNTNDVWQAWQLSLIPSLTDYCQCNVTSIGPGHICSLDPRHQRIESQPKQNLYQLKNDDQ